MRSGYKVLWTENALSELGSTYQYLEQNFSKSELKKLSIEIDKILKLISKNPKMFPISIKKKVRRVVIKRFNTMYYQENDNTIEILSFFSNRQNLDKINL